MRTHKRVPKPFENWLPVYLSCITAIGGSQPRHGASRSTRGSSYVPTGLPSVTCWRIHCRSDSWKSTVPNCVRRPAEQVRSGMETEMKRSTIAGSAVYRAGRELGGGNCTGVVNAAALGGEAAAHGAVIYSSRRPVAIATASRCTASSRSALTPSSAPEAFIAASCLQFVQGTKRRGSPQC